MLENYNVEYDFKNYKINFFDKNGILKEKYKCLAYMITFPLVEFNGADDFYQDDPSFEPIIFRSNKQKDGYLVHENKNHPSNGMVINSGTILEFRNYMYNYDITLKSLTPGPKKIRFMYYNIFYNVASNMNDIYGEETVYDLNNNDIKFTINGQYQKFFVYSTSKDYDFELTIEKSDKKTPVYICTKNCKKSTCFEENGIGYLKIKNKKCPINIPVYQKIISNSDEKTYLYPSFSKMRDLFLEATLYNSLRTPQLLLLKDNDISDAKSKITFTFRKNTNFMGSSLLGFYLDIKEVKVITGPDLLKPDANRKNEFELLSPYKTLIPTFTLDNQNLKPMVNNLKKITLRLYYWWWGARHRHDKDVTMCFKDDTKSYDTSGKLEYERNSTNVYLYLDTPSPGSGLLLTKLGSGVLDVSSNDSFNFENKEIIITLQYKKV